MSKPKATKGKPNAIDIYVGKQLRIRRTLLDLSQKNLAKAIGLTFQQIRKYEIGANRISAGRLHEFSTLLHVPISYFYPEQDSENAASAQEQDNQYKNPLDDEDTLKIVKCFQEIEVPEIRESVLSHVQKMVTLSKKVQSNTMPD